MSSTERRNAGHGRSCNRTSKWINPEKRAAVYLRDAFTCVYCGQRPRGRAYRTHPTAISPGLHVDHVFPRSRGGSNDAANIVTACDVCNRSKSDRTIAEWIAESPRAGRVFDAGRLSDALSTPLDLRAGKEHVGVRARRPLAEYQRTPRAVRTDGAPF